MCYKADCSLLMCRFTRINTCKLLIIVVVSCSTSMVFKVTIERSYIFRDHSAPVNVRVLLVVLPK